MVTSPQPGANVYVSPPILRERFNASQIPGLIKGDVLTPQFLRDDHLRNPERLGEQRCTRSQTIRYLNTQGTWVVEVHQYRRSDGSLGASGLPDPKRMRVGVEVWIAERAET